jgi:hypothetical protein
MSLLGSALNKTVKHDSFGQQSEILSSIVEESHLGSEAIKRSWKQEYAKER